MTPQLARPPAAPLAGAVTAIGRPRKVTGSGCRGNRSPARAPFGTRDGSARGLASGGVPSGYVSHHLIAGPGG